MPICLLRILLCNRKRVWPVYVAIATTIYLLINPIIPDSLRIAAYISACNLLEVLLGALLLDPIVAPNPDLTQLRQFFCLYGLILAPAVASFLASFALDGHFRFPHYLVFDRWFTADSLGAAIVTPLYLSFYKRELFTSRSWLEIIGLFALLAAVSIGIFEQTREPLPFAIMPFLLLFGGRLGLLGSTSGLLMVTVIPGSQESKWSTTGGGEIRSDHLNSFDKGELRELPKRMTQGHVDSSRLPINVRCKSDCSARLFQPPCPTPQCHKRFGSQWQNRVISNVTGNGGLLQNRTVLRNLLRCADEAVVAIRSSSWLNPPQNRNLLQHFVSQASNFKRK